MERARRLLAQGSPEAAIAAARGALQLWPTAADHLWLCELLAEAGRVEDGFTEYRAAIRLDPRDPEPFLRAGTALARAGALSTAVECFGDALGADWQSSLFLTSPDPAGQFLEAEPPRDRMSMFYRRMVLRGWLGGLAPAFAWEILYEPDRCPTEGLDNLTPDAGGTVDGFLSFCADLGYYLCDWSEEEEDPRRI